jgi:transposase
MAADGVATRAITREVNCGVGTAAKWRVRYAKDRAMEEMQDRKHRLGSCRILPHTRVNSG